MTSSAIISLLCIFFGINPESLYIIFKVFYPRSPKTITPSQVLIFRIVLFLFCLLWIGYEISNYIDDKKKSDISLWSSLNTSPQEGCIYLDNAPTGIFVPKAMFTKQASEECSFWHTQNDGTPQAFCEFSQKFPASQHTVLAKTECSKKPPPPEGIVLNTHGTVTDTESKLMWTQCPVGAIPTTNSGCKFQGKVYTWDEAQEIAINYSLGNYNDWRLPTAMELQTLHETDAGDEKQGLAYINRNIFPMPNCNDDWFQCTFWSSSNNAIVFDPSADKKAWVVYFHSPQNPNFVLREFEYMVRLVRNIP